METTVFPHRAAGVVGSPTGHDRFFKRSVILARAISRISTRVSLPQEIELPTDRPVLLAANHASLFDLLSSLIALGWFGLPSRIGVNARFFDNPFGGWFLRKLGCIPFSRENREEAEAAMIEALKAGQVCAMMPEGRIVRPHERVDGVGPGRLGISRIARASGAAIVPIGFTDANQAWPPGSPVPRPGRFRHRITTRLGPPISFETDDHEQNVADLMKAISSLVDHDHDRDQD